jgi:phosphoribosylformylglycinamidine cyclo-ligase
VLLTPTRIYARAVLAMLAVAEVHGLAHVTGGGLPGNVPRALPPGLAARLDPSSWSMPSVMRLIGALGGLDDPELRATFNGGLGMVAVLPGSAASAAIAALADHGVTGTVVGEVVDARSVDGARYVEGPVG